MIADLIGRTTPAGGRTPADSGPSAAGCHGGGLRAALAAVFLSVALALPGPASAINLFVDAANGEDGNSGDSWGNAKKTIGAAMAVADGLSSYHVWVKEGTYNEQVTVPSHVSVKGGFPASATGTDISGRDPLAHPAVVDGSGLPFAFTIGAYHAGGVIGGFSADMRWALGNDWIYQDDGSGWRVAAGPLDDTPNALWGEDSTLTRLYVVGMNGSITSWDGTDWTPMASPTSRHLFGVWGSAWDDVWAVGSGGTILHYDGSGWTDESGVTTSFLSAVHGIGTNSVYAVGVDGAFLENHGSGWQVSHPTTLDLADVFAADLADVWAVGAAGTILHYDGLNWIAHPGVTAANLTGVWGSASDDVWAVGEGGTILHWDGSSWSVEGAPDASDILDIWGADANHVWAVGSLLRPLNNNFGTGWGYERLLGGSDIVIDGFTIVNALEGAVVTLVPASGVQVLGNQIQDSINAVVWFEDDATDVRVADNRFRNNFDASGIEFLRGTRRVDVATNHVWEEPGSDIWGGVQFFGPAETVVLTGNVIHGLGGMAQGATGIAFWATAEGVGVHQNILEEMEGGGDQGILFADPARDVQVTTNLLRKLGGGWCGIVFWDDVQDATVMVNQLENLSDGDAGIKFRGALDGGQVLGNMLRWMDNGWNGIHVLGMGTGLTISGNDLYRLAGVNSGIILWDDTTSALIQDNSMSDFADDEVSEVALEYSGIVLFGHNLDLAIADNVLRDFATAPQQDQARGEVYAPGSRLGIVLLGVSSRADLERNSLQRIAGSGMDGIVLEGASTEMYTPSSQVRVGRNRLEDVSPDAPLGGILLEQYCTNCWVENNIVARSAVGLANLVASLPGGMHQAVSFQHNTLHGNGFGFIEAGGAENINFFINNVVSGSLVAGISLGETPAVGVYARNVLWDNAADWDGFPSPPGGNLAVDPLLRDPAGGDFHILGTSPCRDAGLVAEPPVDDTDGEPRVFPPDVGADEYLDSDGDGMPDWWEIHHDLLPNVDDSAGNPDGDVFSNLEEYRRLTDPRSPDTGTVVRFAIPSSGGAESVANPVLRVEIPAAVAYGVEVDYRVTGGTATLGTDFTLAPGRAVIPAGSTFVNLPLEVLDDGSPEADETVFVGLSNPDVKTVIGTPSQHVYTIQDNDVAGTDLAVTKVDDPDPVATGGVLSYLISVVNHGPVAAANVLVRDTLPSDVIFISSTVSQGSPCQETDQVVECALGTLGVGATATVALVTIAPTTPGGITNTVTVTSDTFEILPGDNTSQAQTSVLAAPKTLTVVLGGQGEGRVQSTPPGIDCPGVCSAQFSAGTEVTLTPQALTDSWFGGWSGGCGGIGSCLLILEEDATVGARFDGVPHGVWMPGRAQFGNLPVGETSSWWTFTLNNNGLGDLRVDEVLLSGDDPGQFRIVQDNCTGMTLMPSPSPAPLMEWPVGAGGNGHWYMAVHTPAGITWESARRAAQRSGGYLATIHSPGENTFVYGLAAGNDALWFFDGINTEGPWLGGYQPPGSAEPGGGWQWSSGEAFSYQHWAPGEPNNNGGAEDRLVLFGLGGARGDWWNDVSGQMNGYVVEFDARPADVTCTVEVAFTPQAVGDWAAELIAVSSGFPPAAASLEGRGIPPLRTLTVVIDPPGTASVTSVPPGIACPAGCSGFFPEGSGVQLLVAPSPGWRLDDIAGGTCGSGGCSVTMGGADQTVTLSFARKVADLTVTKTADKLLIQPGEAVSFTLVVHNGGPDEADQVLVTDPLPAGLGFLAVVPASCAVTGQTVSCSFPQIPAGGTETVVITAAGGAGGIKRNKAYTETASLDPTFTYGDVSLRVNFLPVPGDDVYTVNEDTPLVVPAPGVLANDTDGDPDDVLRVVPAGTFPTLRGGSVVLASGGGFTYTPARDFHGTDSFAYTISDGTTAGANGQKAGNVVINVEPVNDTPLAVDDAYNADEDVTLTVPVPGVLANDTDPDHDPLQVTGADAVSAAGGAVAVAAGGGFTYTPPPDFHGADSFAYTVADGKGGTDQGLVRITVRPANDPPVAEDDSYATDEDLPLSVLPPGVLANDGDPDGDALTATAPGVTAQGGMVTMGAAGGFLYSPPADFSGTDGFTYTVSDGHGGTDTAAVSILVAPVPDPPVARNDRYRTDQDRPLTVPPPGVLGNDTDPDGDALTVLESDTTGTAGGEVSVTADGGFTYTPPPGFFGLDTFTYVAGDPFGGRDEATVTIVVREVPAFGFFEDFQDGRADGFSPDPPEAWRVARGWYRLAAADRNWRVYTSIHDEDYADFTYRASVRRPRGNTSRSFGLLFRTDGTYDNGYMFMINARGYFVIYKRVEGRYLDLDGDWRFSPWIVRRPRAWNRLEVECVGTDLRFKINGRRVARLSDGTFTHGRVGLKGFGSLGDDGRPEVVLFDDVSLTPPEGSAAR